MTYVTELNHLVKCTSLRLRTCTTRNDAHPRRMPGANTSDLAQPLVSLARQLLGAPTVGDALETVALGDANHVQDLVLLKHISDLHGLLKVIFSPVDLGLDAAAVELDLHEVRLLLADFHLANLR